MVEGTIFMLGLGAICGIVLGAASRIFYVWEDPRIAQVESAFAGANCGGCRRGGRQRSAQCLCRGWAGIRHGRSRGDGPGSRHG